MIPATVLPERVLHLSAEHRDALSRSAALVEAVASFDASPSRERAATVRRAIHWFEGAFSRHMAREDAALVPVLEEAMGGWCELPGCVRREHEELRLAIKAAAAALKLAAARPDGSGEGVREAVERLRMLLALHLHREDDWLMPVARAVLTQDQWDDVARRLGASRA